MGEDILKKIIQSSIYIHHVESFIGELLEPMAKYLSAYGTGVATMGNFQLDRSAICYEYPYQFVYHIQNNPNLYNHSELLKFSRTRKVGYATVSSSLLDQKEFHQGSVYKGRYEPNNIKHGCQTTFFGDRVKMLGGVGAIRKNDKPFTEKDFVKIEKVTPHVFYAFSKYLWLCDLNFYNHRSFDTFYGGLLQCDDAGTVKFVNETAGFILSEMGCHVEEGDIIPTELLNEIEKLEDIANGKEREMFFLHDVLFIFGENRCSAFKTKKGSDLRLSYDGDGYVFVFDIEKTSVKYFLSLTKRERQVLRLVATGMLDKEIAHELTVSIKTVQNHMEKIYRKLGVSNRTEAAIIAKKIGIEESDPPKRDA